MTKWTMPVVALAIVIGAAFIVYEFGLDLITVASAILMIAIAAMIMRMWWHSRSTAD